MLKRTIRVLGAKLWKSFKYYFAGGLVAIVPIAVTVYVFMLIVKAVDRFFMFILVPAKLEHVVKFPGFGLIATVVVITLTGLILRNRMGRALQRLIERVVDRVPLMRTLYQAVKRFIEAFLEEKDDRFKRAVAFEYPRKGVYALGFVTGEAKGLIGKNSNEKYLSIFLPTTPNPTSGLYLIVPESETIPINLSVEEVFRIIISGGIAGVEEEEQQQAEKRVLSGEEGESSTQ